MELERVLANVPCHRSTPPRCFPRDALPSVRTPPGIDLPGLLRKRAARANRHCKAVLQRRLLEAISIADAGPHRRMAEKLGPEHRGGKIQHTVGVAVDIARIVRVVESVHIASVHHAVWRWWMGEVKVFCV